ncbi:MAG: 4-hydroxy-tetrahydrodipicolinate synthase [bacterium]|nr:4-hydroxy-tetrahydrodipicolinate synthase [bacterium]MBK7770713.1 4-hydroxy-tetrahydrodipicolinate synthase [bacterium]MBK9473333.1 4-hydroxy-tetrahydrodipicolinate synthase [bacterium]
MADKTWVMPDGVYTALVTPFTADGAVDRAAWRRLVQRQVDGGVAGVVPVGCTGEAAVLTREEREWLVRTAVEVCKGRCAVVAGSGSNCTRESISQTRDVKAWGADAAMLISPYYNKPQQAGLLAHYRAIARAVDIPQVIYNVPGRTAVNILPETVAQLAAEPNVVALKEASGNLAQIEDAIARCDLKVYSGDDGLNFSIYGLGAAGAISVVSNLLPGTLTRMWKAFAAGDLNRAWPLARSLDPVCNACFVETNPVPVKELLSMAGLCRRDPRLPLVPVSEKSLTRLVQFYEGTLAAMLAQDTAGGGA